MNYSLLSDEVLLQQIAAAEADALSAFYDRYGRLVYSLAYYILGEDTSAEDVTQEVFVQLWNHAGTYRADQGKVITWLSSMARHRSIDVLRRKNVRPEGHLVGWADGLSPEIPDEADVESSVDLKLQKQRLVRAMSQLPKEQQTCLALAYFRGYSHQEIANVLDEPLGTVKTRVRLAMQKLRQILVDDRIST